ncbi:MAG: hypothetical protein R3B51_07260 [Thermodesulfobacteriota bacterium]
MEGKYFIVGGMSFTPKEENIEVITSDNVIQYNTAFLTDAEGRILSVIIKINSSSSANTCRSRNTFRR